MIICRICNKEFKNSKSLISHIKIHKISSKEYYDKYLKKENEGICSTCGKNTKFKKFTLGYHKFCSCSCSSISKDTITKRESTNLKIYGTINQFDRDSIKKIIKNKKIKSIESKINLYGYKLYFFQFYEVFLFRNLSQLLPWI